jgi:integrase/recombinase XerD
VPASISTPSEAGSGHVSLDTTNVYAEIDLEMKAKALSTCEPSTDIKSAKRWREQPALMEFLRAL